MQFFRAILHPKLSALLFGGLMVFTAGPGSAAEEAPRRPTLFVLGDSTARNNGKGKNGQPCAGWGTPLADYFDAEKVTVANVAHAGQSSRTYFTNPGDWPSVLPRIEAGDFVLLVFGINDGGPPRDVRSRGSIPGLGDETVELPRADGTVETAHTYGWYMAAMASAARAKGARVYFLTVTTRNIWTNPKAKFRDATPTEPLPADYDPGEDRIERGTGNGRYTQWTKELGEKLHLPVLDLTNLCADRYEKLGREAVDKFYSDHNHTYLAGADFVAASIVAGLKAFEPSPFLPLLSEKGRGVPPAAAKYVSANRADAK
ncbi:MAG TPA: GDSL-type esterase/lipase family protein [Opitutaceae bacterium]|nr:GDSL-type esterase/lipase family protein [Opitutaceae bacterium]